MDMCKICGTYANEFICPECGSLIETNDVITQNIKSIRVYAQDTINTINNILEVSPVEMPTLKPLFSTQNIEAIAINAMKKTEP